MVNLYHSDKESQQHLKVIHAIAEQYRINEELIRSIYEDELRKLQLNAKLKQYLSVLVARHVKEILHKYKNIKEDSGVLFY